MRGRNLPEVWHCDAKSGCVAFFPMNDRMDSDIYDLKESPWANRPETPKKRRRRHAGKTFDEAVNPDLTNTHRRRSRNSGFRRFRHLLKNPGFSKKFWFSLLGSVGLILMVLIIWDLFFRYPAGRPDASPAAYRTTAE